MKNTYPILAMIGCGLMLGCTTTINLSLINSRSPATNGIGTNSVEAATGMDGGGTFTPDTTVTP